MHLQHRDMMGEEQTVAGLFLKLNPPPKKNSLFFEIVFFFSSFSCSSLICAGLYILQVISDLRKNLDLSSCDLPLKILSSQKKVKSQVQARYFSRFT